MTEFWRLFLIIGGGIIFTISVLDSAIRFYKYIKTGKRNANKHFDSKVKSILNDDRQKNCPFIVNAERDAINRDREIAMIKEAFRTELEPIKKDICEIKEFNMKIHHAQITDLQIKLTSLFHDKFDVKGYLTKPEQTNWDKWYSDYSALGGNSDVKKMDDLIQKARMHAALDKAKNSKKGSLEKEIKEEKNES